MNRLIDRFGRPHTYLRISVTDRCNLRCTYCIPEEDPEWMKREDLLTFEEIVRVARVAVGMGVEKIRITGGEPLVRSDVEVLLAELKAIRGLKTLVMTTNGVLLPRKLPHIRSHVDGFNISLDSLHSERFAAMTGRDNAREALEGIEAVLKAGYRNLKINAVVIRGMNDDELIDFARFTAERPVAVRFIEFMPFSGNRWTADHCVPMAEMLARIETAFHLERIPDGVSPISRDYHLIDRATGHRHQGTIGVIASMSQPFCDSCSRLRMTTEGNLMPCLHSPLAFDLRAPLRNGADDKALESIFLEAVGAKPKEHLPAEDLAAGTQQVMIQIGG